MLQYKTDRYSEWQQTGNRNNSKSIAHPYNNKWLFIDILSNSICWYPSNSLVHSASITHPTVRTAKSFLALRILLIHRISSSTECSLILSIWHKFSVFTWIHTIHTNSHKFLGFTPFTWIHIIHSIHTNSHEFLGFTPFTSFTPTQRPTYWHL